MSSALRGVIPLLKTGAKLSDDAVEELTRMLDVLRDQGWSGSIPADEATKACVEADEEVTSSAEFSAYSDEEYEGRLRVEHDGVVVSAMFLRGDPANPRVFLSKEAIKLLPLEIAAWWKGEA